MKLLIKKALKVFAIPFVSNSAVLELRKIPKSEWARLWCKMNVWEFPNELKNVKPDWWDDEHTKEKREMMYQFLEPIMEEISDEIGHKACNREWNRYRMTDEEHEKFWSSSRLL